MSLEDKTDGKAGSVGRQTKPHLPEFQVSAIFKNLPVCRVAVKKTENRINSLKSCLRTLKWEQ